MVLSSTPVHGDLMVFSPSSCGADPTAGHVVVVDTVDTASSQITFVEQNPAARRSSAQSCARCFLHVVANSESGSGAAGSSATGGSTPASGGSTPLAGGTAPASRGWAPFAGGTTTATGGAASNAGGRTVPTGGAQAATPGNTFVLGGSTATDGRTLAPGDSSQASGGAASMADGTV